MGKAKAGVKKIAIGVAGATVLIVGIVAIPYPGPGWLIVFAGLAILATEFEWADRLLSFARGKYNAWTEWIARQPLPTRLAVLALTGVVVIVTIWLVNGFGIVNGILHLPYNWVESPFVR
jgi:uncharacterized protein (TIGR02611 family)